MTMNERLHAVVVLSSRKEAFLYVRQEAEWVHLPVCTLFRKGISLLLLELELRFLCHPARRLVTIMTDVSQLFTFGFFIRILLSTSNNFLQLIPSTLITLKERNIMYETYFSYFLQGICFYMSHNLQVFESNNNLYKASLLFLFLFFWKIKVKIERRVKIYSRKATYMGLQICKFQPEDVSFFDKEDEVFHVMKWYRG